MEYRTRGWYPDPVNLGGLRWWDGEWTTHVCWGGQHYQDRTPKEDVELAAAEQDRRVVRAYLYDIGQRHVVPVETARLLRRDLDRLLVGAVTAPATTSTTRAAPAGSTRPGTSIDPLLGGRPLSSPAPVPAPLAPTPVPAPVPAPSTPTAASRSQVQQRLAEPSRPATPALPSPRQEWWERTRATLRSDLAVHGLAYLGVVLLFVGVFGLISFSFGDVARGLRMVALVAVPTSFFGAAWFLHRRGATTVAMAITLLGGALLPIVAVASLTDGASPDVTGTALPITQASLCAVITAGELWWVRRVANSPVRWTLAPTAWLSVGLLMGVTRVPIPTGEAVVRANAAQVAAMLGGVAATMLLVRRWPHAALARAVSLVALPVAAALVVIEAAVAGTAGWPVVGGVATAVSALLIVECSPRLRAAITPLQTVFVVEGAARLLPEMRPGWVAFTAMTAALLLVEWSGWRRHAPESAMVLLALATLGSLAEPVSGFAAMALLVAWSTWRRLDAPDWMPITDEEGALAGLGSIGMFVTLGLWTTPTTALLSLAAVSLLAALAVRTSSPLASDGLLRWWAPLAAAGTVAASVAFPLDWTVVVAAGAGAVALAIGRLPIAARVWTTTASVVWCAAVAAHLTATPIGAAAIVVAVAAAVLVLLGAFVPRSVALHLAVIGHVAGVVAVGLPGRTGTPSAVAAATLAATWLGLAILHERARVAHFSHVPEWFGTLPPLVTVAAAAAVPILTGRLAPEWVTLPIASAGALLALGTLVPWRRAAANLLAVAAFAAAVVGVIGPSSLDVVRWPTITGLSLALLTTIVIGSRQPVYEWSAWACSGPLAVLLVEATGVERRWSDVSFAVWGAALLLGGIVLDRIERGAARPTDRLGSDRLAPPVFLGLVAFLIGGVGAMVDEPRPVVGWVVLGMGAVVTTVALVRPLPLLAAGLGSATIGVLLLVPWAEQHPWTLAIWAAVVLAAAQTLRSLDLSILGHVVACAAVPLAVWYDSVTITFLAVAALAATLGLVRRAYLYGVMSAVLLLVAAANEGFGWLALACVAVAITSTVLGMLQPQQLVRSWLIAGGAAMTAGAWASFAAWQQLTWPTVMVATVAASSGIVVAAALTLGDRFDLARVWGVVGLGGDVVAALMIERPEIDAELSQYTLGAAALVLAVAAAIVGVRWLTPAFLFVGAILFRGAVGLDGRATLLIGTCTAIVLAFVGVVLRALRPASLWSAPTMGLMVATQFAAALAIDDRATAAAVLLVAAVETAALAVVSGEDYVYVLSPCWVLAAWLVIASEALRGDPNWFTAPIGVVALVEGSMIRWVRRTRPGARYSSGVAGALVLLELGAMSVMVAPMMVQIVTLHLWYALPAIGIGSLLTVWAAITKVRRRLAFGVGSVALACVLLVALPIARAVPEMSGPALWLTVAGIGALAIVVATMMEQGRERIRRLRTLVDETTHDWEHFDGADTAPVRSER